MYFDESGNLGKQDRFFVIACIITKNPKELNNIMKKTLLEIKKRYSYTKWNGHELKANSCKPWIKEIIYKAIVKKAEEKIKECANKFKTGVPLKEGLGLKHHIIGLFGQRLWFYNKTRSYTDKFKIKSERCVGCGKCAAVCPMSNIELDNDKAKGKGKCTMCYRCFSNCPKQAITILGKEVQEQCKIEKYIK